MNKYTLYTRIGWTIAIIFLVGALCYYNIPYLMETSAQDKQPSETASASTSSPVEKTGAEDDPSSGQQVADQGEGQTVSIDYSIPEGGDVGMRCPDFTVPLYGKGPETFTFSDHLGKVIVINFWTTFCTPCVKELPYFETYMGEHKDDVVFIALHGMVIAEKDMDGWFERHPFDITFGHDQTGEVQASLNGNMVYPQTIIVDKHGVIVYNDTIPLTVEKLHELIDPLLDQE